MNRLRTRFLGGDGGSSKVDAVPTILDGARRPVCGESVRYFLPLALPKACHTFTQAFIFHRTPYRLLLLQLLQCGRWRPAQLIKATILAGIGTCAPVPPNRLLPPPVRLVAPATLAEGYNVITWFCTRLARRRT